MNKNNLAVAVYDSQTQAETAIKELRASGFDMQKLSIISRDNPTNQCAVGDHNTSDRMESWGKIGAFWGGIWGGRFPGVGPLLFAGPVIGWLAGAAKGAVTVDGMSALGGGLVNVGIPKNSVPKYESSLKEDRSVVIAHGTAGSVAHARDIISYTRPDSLGVHQPTIDGPETVVAVAS